jgi:hypothetical protein
MKRKHESQILESVLEMTKARALRATPDESRQLRELKEQRQRSERDRQGMAEAWAKLKQEKALLEAARG